MPYKDEVTWKMLTHNTESFATQVINSLEGAENRYQKWQNLRGANTDAQITTELNNRGASIVEADVVALDATLQAFHEMFLFFSNQTAVAGDHQSSCRDFSS